jgi:tetratricopeptide (TPR) repeat protein
MSARSSQSFAPVPDEYTSFYKTIEDEKGLSSNSQSWSAPLRFLTRRLANGSGEGKPSGLNEQQAHELVVLSLTANDGRLPGGPLNHSSLEAKSSLPPGIEKLEEYVVTFLPTHLVRSKALTSVGELLVDPGFINRRVACLGIIEATSRQVSDLLELRKFGGKASGAPMRKKLATDASSPNRHSSEDQGRSPEKAPRTPLIGDEPASPVIDLNASGDDGDVIVCGDQNSSIEVATVLRDGCRLTIDAVYRVVNNSSGVSDSLGMAMCLAAVGEGLLKGRQPRDAMLRLEEAVGIYRGLLGPYHFYVANSLHSVAKALVKLGETRVALLKFAEAARIYEACNASFHFNAIANAQSLASLLVDVGEIEKAESMFEEVISMKKTVYGKDSVPVAKTVNSYAILLAKHGRMTQALRNYEEAKATYEAAPPPLFQDLEFDIKCKYDVTLINLNIASILSKKGDLQRAVFCYEEGVRGLRQHEYAMSQLQKVSGLTDTGKNTAHKHLVAALGRIGSLKLKLGDKDGALEAYMTLLREVHDGSPASSQTEKAKAHIKCATIYRQQEGEEAHAQSISHLREALDMYTVIFGRDHKDTTAIASSLRQWLSEDRPDHEKLNEQS